MSYYVSLDFTDHHSIKSEGLGRAGFDLTGMAWNEEGLTGRLGMEEVGFGLT
jgi:hypothetical protein